VRGPRRLAEAISTVGLGFLLATVPAPTLLASVIVAAVLRSTSWCLSARHVLVMVFGASLIVLPQTAQGRWSLELLLPVSWILAFCVGARAGRGLHALSSEARTRVAHGAIAGVLVTLFSAVWLTSPDGSITWLWFAMHENHWAARLAVLALAIPVVATPFRASAWLWLVVAVAAVWVGSRAVLAGVVLGTVAGWCVRRPTPGRAVRRVALWLLLGASVFAFLSSLRVHIMDGVRGLLPEPPSVNLVPASEDVGKPPWLLEGVQVETIGRDEGGFAITRVTKTEGTLGSRPIVAVDLNAGQPYVLTVILAPEEGSLPGIRIWAPPSGSAPAFVATLGLDDGRLVIGDTPAIALDEASVEEALDGGWHMRVRLVVHGDEGRRVWIGPAPDLRNGPVGVSVFVSRLQVVAEEHAELGYVPTYAGSESATSARSRLEIFAIARRGICQAPHGLDFPPRVASGHCGGTALDLLDTLSHGWLGTLR
jgi:hypothetical protein